MSRHQIGVIGFVVAVFVCVESYRVWAAGPAGEPVAEVVRAKRFELVGEKGELVATIGAMAEGWPGVVIHTGTKQKASISIITSPDGSVVMSVTDGKKQASIDLHAASDGTAGMGIARSDGKTSVSMGISGFRSSIQYSEKGGDMVELLSPNVRVKLLGDGDGEGKP